jgi:thioredoxin-like negative regulator of GroEL
MIQDFAGAVVAPSLMYVNVPWCGYCRKAKPIMEEVGATLGTTVPVISVDGDQHEIFTKAIGVRSYPTILYVDAEGKMTKFEGERTVQNIVGFVCSKASKGTYGFCPMSA